jgi:hypothetical protein
MFNDYFNAKYYNDYWKPDDAVATEILIGAYKGLYLGMYANIYART